MFSHEILEKNENLEIREFPLPHIMCSKRFGHLETLHETLMKLRPKEYPAHSSRVLSECPPSKRTLLLSLVVQGVSSRKKGFHLG